MIPLSKSWQIRLLLFMKILGFEINTGYPDYPFNDVKVINTINPHSYVEAKKDPEFVEALQKADWLIPDGSGIVLAAKVIRGQSIPKIAGSDMHAWLLNVADQQRLKVFYLGSSRKTLSKIEERLDREYSNIQYGSYSPPFKSFFSDEDNQRMVEAVNQFKPDILFVGMTAPKQEKWVQRHKDQIDAELICSVGAVFDFFAGTQNRAPKWMLNLGLEWLHRLILNPRRLWRRNFISTPLFLKDVVASRLKAS